MIVVATLTSALVTDAISNTAGRRVALPAAMRVWVDLTNSPHPLVLRPVVERLRAGGARGGGHRARLRADGRAARSGWASSRS